MKRKKGNADRLTAGAWWSRNRWSCVILAAALVLFIVVRMAAVTFEQPQPRGDEYAEYETGVVTDILSDNTEADTVADGGYRGEQLLLAQVRSGQYEGETMQVYNYVGPLYGQPLKVGQRAVLLISTYSDGSHTATVYEYDRAVGLAVTVGLFLLATVLVGGKVGAKSLVALAVTLVCLFWILIPLLMKGAPTLLTVFLVCAYITVVTMVILGGVCRKTVCAALGTVAGTALALLFAIFTARPSPFYVMDEVEAALDDVNLTRLINAFNELREHAQLIIITHQQRTMSIADALYGITMRSDGVTAVVSQKLSR